MNQLSLNIEKHVVRHYIDSGDYNGLSLDRIANELAEDLDRVLGTVTDLAVEGRISIVSPYQTNPHIKMLDIDIDEQLDGLENRNPQFVCLYPTRLAVESEMDVTAFDDRPFTQKLVLAEPQLIAIPFRLDVLDSYERDPRFRFRFYDFGGTIGVRDEYRDQMPPEDEINLRFGIGYDNSGDRVVAVYLYNLGSMPSRLQRIWQEFLIDSQCTISEEYFKTTILAERPDTMSVHAAVINEQLEINKLFALMGRTGLFRDTFEDEKRPRGYTFFVKPTQGHHDSFVQLLDKMLSDNINIKSFADDVDRTRRIDRGNGEYEIQRIASISHLEAWIRFRFNEINDEDLEIIIDPFREVRRLRMNPSHRIQDDLYDKHLYEVQDQLVWKIHNGLAALRQLLMTDPETVEYEPPNWDGRFTIKSY